MELTNNTDELILETENESTFINEIITNMENTSINNEEELKPKVAATTRRQGRPRKYEYIEIDSNATENTNKEEVEQKVKSNYSSQYYQNHKDIKVVCPICLKNVQKYSIGKHQRTKYCQLVAMVAKQKAEMANAPQLIFTETVTF